ncbi:efflux RND transporter permease subunit, partial [candidate division WOR-3 bacterium]|nr:efflux RND transporter permease subunit [candidate division WOR-3 bacterium]
MSLSGFSIKRPYVVFALLVGVMLFGFISLPRLPVDLLPDVSLPTMVVMIPYPGAGPEEVEKSVLDPVESWIGTLSGLDEITSDASDNLALIQLTFKWGEDLDAVSPEVRDRLDMALSEVPDDVGDPYIIKLDASLLPQMMIGVSAGRDAIQNREVAVEISKRLQRVRNVAAADVVGGEKRQVLVSLDRRKLTTYGIHPSQIEGILAAHNLNYPLGSIKEQGRELDMRLVAEYGSLDEIEHTIVGQKGEMPVYLAEVATVRWSKTEPTSAFNVDGEPGVSIMIQKTPGANTINLSKALTREVESIRKDLPQGMEVTILYDSA